MYGYCKYRQVNRFESQRENAIASWGGRTAEWLSSSLRISQAKVAPSMRPTTSFDDWDLARFDAAVPEVGVHAANLESA